MAKFPGSAQMERRGITHIAGECGELGHIWRETPNSDVGFDGEIELVAGGTATGHIIKVQVRAGNSYIRNETADRFDYYSNANELEYWQEATNPVLLTIFDPRIDSAFWVDVKNYLRLHPEALDKRPHKITFNKDLQLRPLSTEALELLFGPNYDELRHSFMQHIIERFSKLTIYSVNSDAPLAVDLERVFIRLKTTRAATRLGEVVLNRFDLPPDMVIETGEIPFIPIKGTTGLASRALLLKDIVRQKAIHVVPSVGVDVERMTISQALAENLNTAVIGSPGAGKTTLLKYLALTFARNRMEEQLGITESLLPLFISLRDFSRFLDNAASRAELLELGPQLLPDFIASHVSAVAPHLRILVEFFMHYLESSKCILLLDGLDEVAEPLKRIRVSEAIDNFTRQFKGNRFVVTSRPRGYEGETRQRLFNLYTDWTIEDFDDEDMKNFTSNWYEAVTRDRLGDSAETITEARSKADDLLRAIRADRRVAALAHNPLLLSVLAMVHQRGVGLPQRRAELYDECTDMLLGYWDQTKGGEAARELAQYGELDRNEKRTLLEPIALWFHERGQENLEADKKELEGKIADEFRENFVNESLVARKRAELFLRVIDERAGLLVERELNVYSFAHLTFQEYLAARSIADSDNYIEYTVQRVHDDWWREVILLEIGHLSDGRHFGRRGRKLTTELIRRLREAGSPLESVLRRDLFLVGRALADINPLGVDDELRQGIYDELIDVWRSTPFELQQREAVEVLGYILPTTEGSRIRTQIVSLLDHDDPQLVILALKAIGQIGIPLSNDDLTGQLLALTHHLSPTVRSAAATCVEKIRTTRATKDVTVRMLELAQDSDSVVRLTAANHLLSLGRAGMRNEIIECLFRLGVDEALEVSDVAIRALVRISQTRSREVVEQKLLDLTKDAASGVRASGAVAVGHFVKLRANQDLVRTLLNLTNDIDEVVRDRAFASFELICFSPRRKFLIDCLRELSEESDDITRESAMKVLNNLNRMGFGSNQRWYQDVEEPIRLKRYVSPELISVDEVGEYEEEFLTRSANPDPRVRLGALNLLDRSPLIGSVEHFGPKGKRVNINVTYVKGLAYSPGRLTRARISDELEEQVETRLLELISDDDITIRLRAAISYRKRLNLPYKKSSLEILEKFWLDHVYSIEEVSWEDNRAVCNIAYEELQFLAKILPQE